MYAPRFEADAVVHGSANSLLATEMALRRLNRAVTQKEMDLVQLASGLAAQAGASPPEVMRGKLINGCPFGAFFHDMSHNPLRYTISPSFSAAANATGTRDLHSVPRMRAMSQ